MSKHSACYTLEEMNDFGFAEIGADVRISRKCSIYSAESIRLGNNVRVDDFCILSGNITIGSNIHVAAYTALYGGGGIELKDFSNLSSRVVIYSVSDDFSGETLTNPTIPERFKHIFLAPVAIGRHVIIGTGSTVMPGTIIGDGCAIGAMSMVNRNLDSWGIYAGIPVQRLKERKRDLLELEEEYLRSIDPCQRKN